ncbi:hypothetical protein [Tissierella pigra]|uniref:Uncharacterized protein n=1 Tax=Tissierella pigra TaxID=2607614 RepID=A0A6N7XH75_9FIRM|nr:hypothetical protein [Tissierella pigra]MSU01379.1 hypothetical protein [Tissierella pigra]
MKLNLRRTEELKEEKTQRDDFNQKWYELLINNKLENMLEFEKIAENSVSEVLTIMQYRNILKSRGRGQDITLNNLLDCQIKEESHLLNTLQEMFLEPISNGQIEYFYKKASEKYNDMNEAFRVLYKRRLEDQGLRFMSIVLTI